MTTHDRGHRPESYPSPPQQYQVGALAARRFLQQTQKRLRRERQFEPAVLREMLDYNVGLLSLDYRAGFLDALGAYVLLNLEGCQLDPDQWDVLVLVKRHNKK